MSLALYYKAEIIPLRNAQRFYAALPQCAWRDGKIDSDLFLGGDAWGRDLIPASPPLARSTPVGADKTTEHVSALPFPLGERPQAMTYLACEVFSIPAGDGQT
tara:strand:- start:2756 stop:3064 length:309 start_codon:yes stop_codon:yes gene_type:complete